MSFGHHQYAAAADSPLRRLPAHCKLLALFVFVGAVVATPATQFWAFACYVILLVTAGAIGHIPILFFLRRLTIELPFVLFAIAAPFLTHGEEIRILGISLSIPGLFNAWNILAKGTLGVTASTILAATTDARQILIGLHRLRLPQLLIQIAFFMIRYMNVITDNLRQMRIAREARAFDARGISHLPILAQSAGALIVRSYERGERVYLAMRSRGYNGQLPLPIESATMTNWLSAVTFPIAAVTISAIARVMM